MRSNSMNLCSSGTFEFQTRMSISVASLKSRQLCWSNRTNDIHVIKKVSLTSAFEFIYKWCAIWRFVPKFDIGNSKYLPLRQKRFGIGNLFEITPVQLLDRKMATKVLRSSLISQFRLYSQSTNRIAGALVSGRRFNVPTTTTTGNLAGIRRLLGGSIALFSVSSI